MRESLGPILGVITLVALLLLIIYAAGRELTGHNVEQCLKLCAGNVARLSYGTCECATGVK